MCVCSPSFPVLTMSAAASSASAPCAPTLKLSSGGSIPVVGFGTWRAAPGETESSVYCALQSGYRHIDCAVIYANQKEVGAGIARALKEGLLKREELFVTTKVWNDSHTADRTHKSMMDSLADLQLDYLDLVLIHWPVEFAYLPEKGMFPRDDKGVVINDTDLAGGASVKACWQALESLVQQGLVRSIGVSNFSMEEIQALMSYAKIKPVCDQVELQPYFQQEELLAFAKSQDMILVAYSPLGNLRHKGTEHDTPLNDPVVASLAKKHGKSPAQIILRWGVQHGHVVLPKSVTPSRIRENIAIFDFELSKEDMEAMRALGNKHKRYVNPNFAFKNGASGAHVFPKSAL